VLSQVLPASGGKYKDWHCPARTKNKSEIEQVNLSMTMVFPFRLGNAIKVYFGKEPKVKNEK
jgi:hypothetical protein